MRNKPTRYFIEYQDERKWTRELQEHHIEETLTDEDAATLEDARTLAALRGKEHRSTHVGIYERVDFEENPPGVWQFEVEHREDA